MVGTQIPEDKRDEVISVVSPNLNTHSIWRNDKGEWWTQCGQMAVSATGFVRNGWKASYRGSPEGTSWDCRACRRAM